MTSMTPRPAATVMLLRDAPAGLEVFMLRRNDALEFSPGAHVFPGGAVDAADLPPSVADVCGGRTDAEASRQLGVDADGLGYWVAAIRECYEEAGVLLARRRDGAPLVLSDLVVSGGARQAVAADEITLTQLCRDHRLELATDAVHYFGHWVTPVGPPRRYDTRFFVTRAPADQSAVHDDVEAVGSEWVRPLDALERGRSGGIGLIEPTLRSLTALARFDRADEVLSSVAAAVADDGTVAMRSETQGRRVHLPYDETGSRDSAARAVREPAARRW